MERAGCGRSAFQGRGEKEEKLRQSEKPLPGREPGWALYAMRLHCHRRRPAEYTTTASAWICRLSCWLRISDIRSASETLCII